MAAQPRTCVCHGKTFPSKAAVVRHYKANARVRQQEDWNATFGHGNQTRQVHTNNVDQVFNDRRGQRE